MLSKHFCFRCWSFWWIGWRRRWTNYCLDIIISSVTSMSHDVHLSMVTLNSASYCRTNWLYRILILNPIVSPIVRQPHRCTGQCFLRGWAIFAWKIFRQHPKNSYTNLQSCFASTHPTH